MSDFLNVNSIVESYKTSSEDCASSEDYDFELGHTFFQAGKFKRSVPYLTAALNKSLSKGNYDDYLNCYNLLMHACTELCETEVIKKLQLDFEKNSQKFGVTENIKTLVTVAYYLMNSDISDGAKVKSGHAKGFETLTKALKLALDEYSLHFKGKDFLKDLECKIDIMRCLLAFSHYYCRNKEYEKCVKDLENLKILVDYYFNLKEELQLGKSKTDDFQDQKNYYNILKTVKKNYQYMQRMKLKMKSLEAQVELQYKKDLEKSDKILWECYELANKTNNNYFVPYILFYMAENHVSSNDLEQAEIFLNLAEKNADPDRKLFLKTLELFKNTTGVGKGELVDNYDIIFNEEDHSIVEKKKGCVNFKNQFILLDILKLFISNQGDVYSKQNLVETVWKQQYSPSTHDNKVYVTIKRLRELLEADINNPRYICRNSGGYYLNEKVRILVK